MTFLFRHMERKRHWTEFLKGTEATTFLPVERS